MPTGLSVDDTELLAAPAQLRLWTPSAGGGEGAL